MVVWAVVPDRNGIFKPAPRPLLITSVHPTDKRAPFVVHCISTRKDNPASDPVIEMPWNAKDGAGVGLHKWCAVVLRWPWIIEQANVADITGEVDAAFLERVLAAVAAWKHGSLPL